MYNIDMPTSITIQLNTYQSYLTKLEKAMKKNPDNNTLKSMYLYWQDEHQRLMAYAFMPRLTDEEYTTLEIY